MSELGRLKKVELRDIWQSEALDFTPWLALPDNLALLGETLSIDLELEAVERNVGPFRADILCKDIQNGSWVLVENQLERTDHTHLGQLITYAAGLDAVTIVWIAAKIAEEHRAACDWLNQITTENVRFFALEVELWRISDSPAAPKFNVVSKPNTWRQGATAAKNAIDEGAFSETQQMQFEYWKAFEALLAKRNGPVKARAASTASSWIGHAIGKSGFSVNAAMNTVKNLVRAELYLSGPMAKARFGLLLAQKDEIETSMGEPLDWQQLPDNIECRICLTLHGVSPFDQSDWPRQHSWLADKATNLHTGLRPFVMALPTPRPQGEDA